MHLEHIGRITGHRRYWRLVYEGCGHDQEFARVGLERLDQAIREVRRYYAECLTCRLGERQTDPTIYPAEWGEPPAPRRSK